ncbi:unnamed protein product, partial [Prorocentrum cordatum]
AVTVFSTVDVIISDLQSLVKEGNNWSDDSEAAEAMHAGVWRDIRGLVHKRELSVPKFHWCPSHLDSLDVVDGLDPPGLDPIWALGNSWADYFAKRGAAEMTIAKGYMGYVQHVFDEGRMMVRYLSWGLARLCQQQLWENEKKRTYREKHEHLAILEH